MLKLEVSGPVACSTSDKMLVGGRKINNPVSAPASTPLSARCGDLSRDDENRANKPVPQRLRRGGDIGYRNGGGGKTI
ncbi:hypothetical protein FKM82_019561 [Ascaphus truei]